MAALHAALPPPYLCSPYASIIWLAPERAADLDKQLHATRRAAEEAAVQLRAARGEAMELRAAKEAATVEKERAVIRAERASKQLQVPAADGA